MKDCFGILPLCLQASSCMHGVIVQSCLSSAPLPKSPSSLVVSVSDWYSEGEGLGFESQLNPEIFYRLIVHSLMSVYSRYQATELTFHTR